MELKIKAIVPEKTAVLVIDMQNSFVADGAPLYTDMGNKILGSMAAFLDKCRGKGMRLIYTQETKPPEDGSFLIDGSPGHAVHPTVQPKEEDTVIKKRRYSGFFGTTMDLTLRDWKIDTVAIIGVCTDVCCFSTARDAMFLNYKVAFLSDMTGTFAFADRGYGAGDAQAQHDMALRNIAFTTGHVMTSDEFLALVQG